MSERVHMVGPLRYHLFPLGTPAKIVGEPPVVAYGMAALDPTIETPRGFIVCGAPGDHPWNVVSYEIVDVTCKKCLALLERAVFTTIPRPTDHLFHFLAALMIPEGLDDMRALIAQASDADPAALAVLADWFREREGYAQIANMLDRCYRCDTDDDPAVVAMRKRNRERFGYVEREGLRQPGDPCPHARQLAILRRFFVPRLDPVAARTPPVRLE